MKHALLSPSSSHRWIPCPGSVALSKGEPNPPSTYSDEGTAAHHVASEALQLGVNAQAFVGLMVGLWGGAEGDESECFEKMFNPLDMDAVNGILQPDPPPRTRFRIEQEMVGHVQTYVDKIREYAKGNELFVEQKLSTESVTGEEGGSGTSDAVILNLAAKELQVHDLKYGMGNRVDALENSQLKIYALSALEEFSFMCDFERVRFVIHQPRLDHLSEWDCSVGDLVEWGEGCVKPQAQVALALMDIPSDRFETEGPAFCAGEHCKTAFCAGEHCKTAFCPSRAKCPTLAAYVAESVGASFEVLDEVEVSVKLVKQPESLESPYDLPTLGKKLSAVDVIEDWCKAVRAKVESILLEHNNSALVVEALGFKLVQGRKGARQWADEDAARTMLKGMKLKDDEMYKPKVIISPTVCETVLKEFPKKWEKVAKLITQKEGGPSVAPVGDKRPALVSTPVAESFDDLDGGDLV